MRVTSLALLAGTTTASKFLDLVNGAGEVFTEDETSYQIDLAPYFTLNLHKDFSKAKETWSFTGEEQNEWGWEFTAAEQDLELNTYNRGSTENVPDFLDFWGALKISRATHYSEAWSLKLASTGALSRQLSSNYIGKSIDRDSNQDLNYKQKITLVGNPKFEAGTLKLDVTVKEAAERSGALWSRFPPTLMETWDVNYEKNRQRRADAQIEVALDQCTRYFNTNIAVGGCFPKLKVELNEILDNGAPDSGFVSVNVIMNSMKWLFMARGSILGGGLPHVLQVTSESFHGQIEPLNRNNFHNLIYQRGIGRKTQDVTLVFRGPKSNGFFKYVYPELEKFAAPWFQGADWLIEDSPEAIVTLALYFDKFISQLPSDTFYIGKAIQKSRIASDYFGEWFDTDASLVDYLVTENANLNYAIMWELQQELGQEKPIDDYYVFADQARQFVRVISAEDNEKAFEAELDQIFGAQA